MLKFLPLISLFFFVGFSSKKVFSQNKDFSIQIKSDSNTFVYIPPPKRFVNDWEQLFTEVEINILEEIIKKYEKETTTQIVIVTIDTNKILINSLEYFDSLTLYIANKWRVGQAGKNNGILIGISKNYRKIMIQNGLGIEKIITDEESTKLVYDKFIPYFKKQEYFEGTQNGLNKLIELLNSKMK